nr:kunitz type trypsin inhibitor 104-like [Ziziphus jujuba var. spinosa]
MRPSFIWLVMAMVTTAQIIPSLCPPVVDTTGQPLRRGLEYYIKPALLDTFSGPSTLVEHNISSALCPNYVREGWPSSNRLPVAFEPVEENDLLVRERKNFKATFYKPAKCEGSTTWKVGKRDEETQKRLIETGDGGRFGNLFLIDRSGERFGESKNIYNLRYCPTEICPTCKFECGNFEALILENRERFMSLGNDGAPVAVEFERIKLLN